VARRAHYWWRGGVIYHVYPRSFMDSDGDGVGDLPGITRQLPYLSWLGVDGVWISPFYPSPMADFGYDVSNHTDVDPLFGTLEDFDALVREAHGLGLKVILDFVPNHTSDRHPWFIESRSSRDNPKRDRYIWRVGKPDGTPPNNWVAGFGGEAWEWDTETERFYYHAYLKEQPDLNWRNPEVRKAMLDVLRFWLERGVDGFRVDALRQLMKDDLFRDNPPNPEYRPGDSPYDAVLPVYSADRPEVHAAIREMRGALAEFGDDKLLVGELYLPIERLVTYYGEDGEGVHLPMNFHLISSPWDARAVAALIREYEAALPPDAWPTWVLGNHDRSRVASRVGPAQARVAAMLLLTLRGTPTIYYGDEIGMHDVGILPELVRDPWEKNVPGVGLGRDPERTPMQWDASPNAGFTSGEPWLPVPEDHEEINVETQKNAKSMLTLHRRLLSLRRSEPALCVGSCDEVAAEGDLLRYVRSHNDRRFLVVLNLGEERCNPDGIRNGRIVLNSHLDREGEMVSGSLALRGDEGAVVEI
jgi:alpha-glucosidase